MIRIFRRLLLSLGAMGAVFSAVAQDAAPAAKQPAAGEDSGPVANGPTLSAEEMAAATKLDLFSIPTPGELMAAIDKLGTPDWESVFREPISTSGSRPQMALNIGGLIADGFLAVEAENSQQVKNIGKDIITLAKPLGVQQDILNRGKSLTDFAEHGQWNTLKEELEATQNEVKAAMVDNKDSELITLVTLGGWVRGIEAMADYVEKHYSPEGARLLRQPAVARFLSEKVNALPERVRDDASVKKTRAGLQGIEKAVSFPSGTPPSQEAVRDLAKLTKDLLKEISKKK